MSKKTSNQHALTQKKLKNSFSTTSSSSSNSSPDSTSSADELTSNDDKLTKQLKSDFLTSNSNSSSSDMSSSESKSSNCDSNKSNSESELNVNVDADEQKGARIDLNNLFNGVSKALIRNSRKKKTKKTPKPIDGFKKISGTNLSDREMIENVLNKRPCLTNLTNSSVITAKTDNVLPKTSPVKTALSRKCSSSKIEQVNELFYLKYEKLNKKQKALT